MKNRYDQGYRQAIYDMARLFDKGVKEDEGMRLFGVSIVFMHKFRLELEKRLNK